MGESKNDEDDGPVKEVVGFFRKVQRAVPRDWKNLGIDIRTIIPGKKPPKKSSFDDLNKAIAGSLRPKVSASYWRAIQHRCFALLCTATARHALL